MLDRPPPKQSRKARWRDRSRRGVIVPRGVEVSAAGLDFLIQTRWLAECDASDRAAIGRAISAMLEDAGRRR